MSTKSITSTESNKDVLGQFGQIKSASVGSFGSADNLGALVKPVLFFRSASEPSPETIKYSPQPDLFSSPATSSETPASNFTTKSSTSLSSTSSIPTEQVASTVAEPILFGEHMPTCYFSEPHLLRYTAKLNTSSAPHIDMQEKIVQQLSVDTSDPEEETQEHNLAGIEIEDDISDEETPSPTYAQRGFQNVATSPKTTIAPIEQGTYGDHVPRRRTEAEKARFKAEKEAMGKNVATSPKTTTQQLSLNTSSASSLKSDYQIKANVGSGAPMVHNCCKNGVCNTCMPILKGTTFIGRPVAPCMDALEDDFGLFD